MISLSNIHITYELYFSGILGVSLYVPFGAPDQIGKMIYPSEVKCDDIYIISIYIWHVFNSA